jgi:hypothetical protein
MIEIDALVAVFLHQTEGFLLRILGCVVLSTQSEQEENETTTTTKRTEQKYFKEKRNMDRKKNYDRSNRIMCSKD